MKSLNIFVACMIISALACEAQADPVPPDAFGLYLGTGKGTSVIVEPGKFNVTYFLEIVNGSMAELVFVQEGKPPSAPITGSCYFIAPGHLLLKFPTGPENSLSGTFTLKGKAGKYSIKGTMNTIVEGYIGVTQIASKFKQNPT